MLTATATALSRAEGDREVGALVRVAGPERGLARLVVREDVRVAALALEVVVVLDGVLRADVRVVERARAAVGVVDCRKGGCGSVSHAGTQKM